MSACRHTFAVADVADDELCRRCFPTWPMVVASLMNEAAADMNLTKMMSGVIEQFHFCSPSSKNGTKRKLIQIATTAQ